MTVQNGQDVSAQVTNPAFISKTDTSTQNTATGIVGLNNATSGAQILNVQQAINDNIDDIAQNASDILENASDIGDIRTLTNTADGDTDMGAYVAAPNGFSITDNEHLKTNIQELIDGVDGRIALTEKGAANGVAELDGSGTVPSSQLPSFVDDVEEYADFASLPATGETGKIYVTLDDNKTYRWSGSAYIEISPSAVESVNGEQGIVVLDTDDIAEGATNLYYTDARADGRIAAASIGDLSDVDLSTPPDVDQALIWNGTNWVAGDVATGGGFMATDFSNAIAAANNINLGGNDLVNVENIGGPSNTVSFSWVNFSFSTGYIVRDNGFSINRGTLGNTISVRSPSAPPASVGYGMIANAPNGQSITNKSLGISSSNRSVLNEASGNVRISTGDTSEANTGDISLVTGIPSTSGNRGQVFLQASKVNLDGLTFTKGMAPSLRTSGSSPLNIDIEDEYIRMQAGAGQVVNLPDLSGIGTSEPKRYIIKNGDPANSLDIVDNVNNNGFDDGGSTLTLAVGESVELVAFTAANLWLVFNKG